MVDGGREMEGEGWRERETVLPLTTLYIRKPKKKKCNGQCNCKQFHHEYVMSDLL